MTEVSEQMVEAACAGYWPTHWPQHMSEKDAESIRANMRAALTAALAVAPKLRVRKLEWVPFGDGMFTAKAPPIGTYAIEDGYLPLKLNGHTIGRHESAAEAKAAAQADYEARILSALEDGQ